MRRRQELRVRSHGERIGGSRGHSKFERTHAEWAADEVRGREESESAHYPDHQDIRRQPDGQHEGAADTRAVQKIRHRCRVRHRAELRVRAPGVVGRRERGDQRAERDDGRRSAHEGASVDEPRQAAAGHGGP